MAIQDSGDDASGCNTFPCFCDIGVAAAQKSGGVGWGTGRPARRIEAAGLPVTFTLQVTAHRVSTPTLDTKELRISNEYIQGRSEMTQKSDAPFAGRASRMRVNSLDVAKATGVSRSAVSRAFTPGASLAPGKKALILAAARDLGYRPNVMARAIAKGCSNVVGLLMFGETNRHHPEVLLALSRAFGAGGVRVMLFIVEDDSEIEDVVDNILSYQLDGVIAAAPIPEAELATLERAEVPVIFYNRPGTSQCASVSCDHVAAGRIITKHSIDQGHREFALIYSNESFVADERMRGVEAEILASGAEVIRTAHGDYAYDSGFAAMQGWLSQGPPKFTAVIAANDLMAIGALDALNAGVPDKAGHISVAGFDAVDPSRWNSHRIASVCQPIEAMTTAAAEMMIKRFGQGTQLAEYRLFPGQLQPGPTFPITSKFGGRTGYKRR